MLKIDVSGIEIPNYLEIKEKLDIASSLIKHYKIQSEEIEIYTPIEIEGYKERLKQSVTHYNNLIDSLKVQL